MTYLKLPCTVCLLLGLVACSTREPQHAPAPPPAVRTTPDVAQSRCPHGLTPTLCTSCTPELAAVFKSKGDWCDTHDFPESLCPVCHPNLKLPDVGSPTIAATDWCGGHGLPESMCTVCHPNLVETFKAEGDWCEEHGYPESACPVCNPMAAPSGASAAADWCVEHGLPESKCSVCDPTLVETFKAEGDWCKTHGYPESACPTCNPQRVPVGSTVGGAVLLQEEAITRSNIRVATAKQGRAGARISVPAEVQLNPDRVAHVSPLMSGQLQSIAVALGDTIKANQELAVIRSVELGQSRAALKRASALLDIAEQNLERQQTLRKEGINSQRSVLEAKQAHEHARAERDMARSTLQVFGVQSGRGADMSLTSPIAGVIVGRHATRGENVTSEDTIFVVADVSRVWIIGHIYEQDIAHVYEGMPATLTLNAYPEKSWTGKVDYISRVLDEHTRSLPVRVELDNSELTLRPGLYGTLELSTTGTKGAPPVLVPERAVQTLNDQPVVFVLAGDGEYMARAVRLGERHAAGVDVIEGLSASEQIVVEGAFVLKSEVMRHALGEGCAH